MAKVYLYEDSGGGLYLHLHDHDTVYANIEVMVPYGATFEQDASEIADGREVTGDGVLKIPYSEFEAQMLDYRVHRVAAWDEGRIIRYSNPGRDGELYLDSQREINPAANRDIPS